VLAQGVAGQEQPVVARAPDLVDDDFGIDVGADLAPVLGAAQCRDGRRSPRIRVPLPVGAGEFRISLCRADQSGDDAAGRCLTQQADAGVQSPREVGLDVAGVGDAGAGSIAAR
jgi:hypothetical protein